jgi:cob(I)alamin adenosyltransferase
MEQAPTGVTQTLTQEEEKMRNELQSIFIDLLTSAQELSYEIATLEPKDNYTKDEIKDLLEACRKVVGNVKHMHRFLQTHAKKK